MIKPMLACKVDWTKLKYPCFVSPKIDGIRCLVIDGKPYSRSGKLIPNKHIRSEIWNHPSINGLDGELVVGDPTAPDVYNKSMSGIMSQSGTPDFTYLVFDDLSSGLSETYFYRLEKLTAKLHPVWVKVLPQVLCNTQADVEAMEQRCIELGYEGVVARARTAPYKQGRSTVNEGYLVKIKRFGDAEAVVIGFEELMHNRNEATTDVHGYTKRTSHKANQKPGRTLGALQVVLASDPDIRFSIGTGFDQEQRQYYWNHRDKLVGRIVKFRYMPYGMLESTHVPRFPVFLGWRDPIDM